MLQEGLEILMPYMSDRRKVNVPQKLFLEIVDKGSLTLEEVRAHTDAFEEREHGSAVMITGEVYATVWIGVNNVSLMVNKEEIKSFRFLMQ